MTIMTFLALVGLVGSWGCNVRRHEMVLMRVRAGFNDNGPRRGGPQMVDQDAGSATVVVSRRIAAGHEDEYERWLRATLKAVQKAPGYLEASARPPGPDHPDEWVVVYRFSSTALLDLWLESPEREVLVQRSAAFLSQPPSEQRLVEPPSEAVTLVSSVQLRPEAEDEHRRLHDQAMGQARALGGLARDELLPAIVGAQPETVSLLTFVDRASLDRWLASDDRREAVARMDHLIEGERTVNVVGDFAGWFGAQAGEAKRWKQAVVIWFALVPTSMATAAVRSALLPELDGVAAVALSAVVNIIILTWLVMPTLTKALRGWLVR
jgi:antibiotic biosynthesis monooxygenase (ABM) superfamily enzyme